MPQTPTQTMRQFPLCVDIDGTLVRTDLLHESVFALIKRDSLDILRLPLWLLKGKAHVKSKIAERVSIDAAALPYNEAFLEYLHQQHQGGRRLILATASNIKFAQAIAAHTGIFDEILASDDHTNLSGRRKAEQLVIKYGDRGFDYAGNAHVDKDVWEHSGEAIVVNPSRGLLDSIPNDTPVAHVFEERAPQIPTYLKAMRPHQWLKNLLVFVPLILAHRVQEPDLLFRTVLAFIAFSLTASGIYLLNDLLDLQSDRIHATKRYRPFASGNLSVVGGSILMLSLLLAAASIATTLPTEFQMTLGAYFIMTVSYSIRLKKAAIIDVLLLAGFYTLRIIAGAAAILVKPSFWILAFSMFLFLSLALLKRFTELRALDGNASIKGRGYGAEDIETLAQFGTASGYLGVLVLALYIDGEAVKSLYRYPEVLWSLCPIMLYLVSRIWLLARRGLVDEDPVVFLIQDRRSQAFMLLGALALALAT